MGSSARSRSTRRSGRDNRSIRSAKSQRSTRRLLDGDRNLRINSISFLISKFPEGLSKSDIRLKISQHTKGLGRIVDVVIPTKLDRAGDRFGFARFRDVISNSAMIRKLNDIHFDSVRIRATLAKQHKPPTQLPRTRNPFPPPPPHKPTPPTPTANPKKTFLQAVLANIASPNPKPQPSKLASHHQTTSLTKPRAHKQNSKPDNTQSSIPIIDLEPNDSAEGCSIL